MDFSITVQTKTINRHYYTYLHLS